MERVLKVILILQIIYVPLAAQDIFQKKTDAFYTNKSIEDIIKDIEKKHTIHFSYSVDYIDLSQKKTIECKNLSLQTLISLAFKDEPIGYTLVNNTVALRKIELPKKLFTFSGTVVDSSTHKAIAFASVSAKGTSKGTVTNEDGEFTITIESIPSLFIISHLGYKNKQIQLQKESLHTVIKLAPSIIAVEEIAVTPADLYSIVQNAYKKMQDNFDKTCFGKAYYKQKTLNNNICSEYIEGLYEVEANHTGLVDWELKAGRYFLRDDINTNDYIVNLNFTWFYTQFSSIDKGTYDFLFPVSANVWRYYNLQLMGYLKYNDKLLTIIGFNSRKKYNVPAFQGYIYIDGSTGDIYRLNGELSHPELNIIKLKNNRSNWENYSIRFDIFFSEKTSDMFLPDHIKISHSFDHIRTNKFNRRVETKSSLVFYDYYPADSVVDLAQHKNTSTSDFQKIKNTRYTDDYWTNLSILKRTIDEQESVSSFSQSGLQGDLVQFLENYPEEMAFNNKPQVGFNPEVTEINLSTTLYDIGTYIHSSSLTGIILNENSSSTDDQTQEQTIRINEKYITYNGSPKNSIYGDPFLYNEWYKGNVYFTKNRVINNIYLKYDCASRAIYCKDNEDHIYRLNNSSVQRVTIFSPMQIITLENVLIPSEKDPDEKTQKYLTVIYQGKFSLYKLQEKYFQPVTYLGMGYDNGVRNAKFSQKPVVYYIKGKDNNFYKVKLTKRDVLKTLTTSDKEFDMLIDYSRTHKLFFRDIYDVARTLRYYGVKTLNEE